MSTSKKSYSQGNNNNNKKHKRKLCPECESGYLQTSIKKRSTNGIIYSNRITFCPECGYRVNEKNKRRFEKKSDLIEDEFVTLTKNNNRPRRREKYYD